MMLMSRSQIFYYLENSYACQDMLCSECRSGSRGGSGFWERGSLIHILTNGGRGRAPSRDSKRVWGSADSSPSGVWGFAPAAFLLLRLFSMKFTVISNTYTSRDIRITRACMYSDEKNSSFFTMLFTCRSINDSCMFYYNISIVSLFSSIVICFLRKRI